MKTISGRPRRAWRRGRGKRRARGDLLEPVAQLRMLRSPVKMRVAGFHAEAAGERDLRHAERAMHQRVVDLRLPEIHHPPGALRLMLENAWRTLVLRSCELSAPHRYTIDHAPCQRFEAARFRALVAGRRIEGRRCVEVIQVGADEGGFLETDAVVTHEVGDAARRIDAVIRAVRNARLRDDDLDAALQAFL